MTAFRDSYPVIQPYEKFKELINKRGLVLLQEEEPKYCECFRTCETLSLKPSQTLKECNPLLSGKFNRFVDLLESLYEVGYYWKRLTETARLIEISVPETPHQQMNEASWFIYNLDSYWHAVYGLEERIIRFLTILKRMYKSPSNEEEKSLEVCIEAIKMVEAGVTKKVRNPLAHLRSQLIEAWRDEHIWESAILRNDKSNFTEIYDKSLLQQKESHLAYIRPSLPHYSLMLSIIFDTLCTLSLEKLEL